MALRCLRQLQFLMTRGHPARPGGVTSDLGCAITPRGEITPATQLLVGGWTTHLKNMSQIGSLPQIGVKIKNIWDHHLDYVWPFL